MRLIIIFIAVFASANEWFITTLEYGKMLYHNPRGISCAKCHGENAKGKIIAKYIKKGKTYIIKAPDIQNISYDDLKNRLLHYKKLSVMPRYSYLTKKEIEALYLYIHSIKGKK